MRYYRIPGSYVVAGIVVLSFGTAVAMKHHYQTSTAMTNVVVDAPAAAPTETSLPPVVDSRQASPTMPVVVPEPDSAPPAAPPVVVEKPVDAPPSSEASVKPPVSDKKGDKVTEYLYEHYRMSERKSLFFKDEEASNRRSMTVKAYVIGGMDPGFRMALYHLGKGLDAAGIQWSIYSAFRDDFRQRIATGFKARVGHSMHGGSVRVGGYGHGRAADLQGVEGSSDGAVWHFIDAHPQYHMFRPMKLRDPGHVQANRIDPPPHKHHHHEEVYTKEVPETYEESPEPEVIITPIDRLHHIGHSIIFGHNH